MSDFWADADIISTYSRQQAIDDGVLVDIENPVRRQHYRYPIACTAAVWGIIEKAVNNPNYSNDYNGVIHDILWMSRAHKQQVSPTTVLFQVRITGAGRKRNFTFKMVCGPDDDGSPCLTIMLPEED